jgi:hypothetical protein
MERAAQKIMNEFVKELWTGPTVPAWVRPRMTARLNFGKVSATASQSSQLAGNWYRPLLAPSDHG